MNYIRGIWSDVRLKYHVYQVVSDCVLKREEPSFTTDLIECVELADAHAQLVLAALRKSLLFSNPISTYNTLLLLEQLVSLCNYTFHLALAQDYAIQDKIIYIAARRAETTDQRTAQRLARLTLLEYSRIFVDDRDLLRLSALASSFENRTRKSLLRSINIQHRKVHFRDVESGDIIPISPKESLGSVSAGAAREVRPFKLAAAPEVWPCHVCAYLNAPSATKCAACETQRWSASQHSSPHHLLHSVPPATEGSAAPAETPAVVRSDNRGERPSDPPVKAAAAAAASSPLPPPSPSPVSISPPETDADVVNDKLYYHQKTPIVTEANGTAASAASPLLSCGEGNAAAVNAPEECPANECRSSPSLEV